MAAERLDASGAYETGAPPAAAAPTHVITEGTMTVVVDEPTEVVPDVVRIVTAAGGFVESRSEQAPTEDRSGRAWLVLRIPADRLDGTLSELEALGRLSTRDTSATDVSLTVADLDARIKALETSIDRLLAMLAEAQRTEDLISLERTLQERQGELDSLRSQRTVLGNRVALATIELTLTSDPPPVTVGPGGFWPGVVAGWNALVDTLRGASVVIGMLLPWLVVLGIPAFFLTRLVRAARRRRPPRPARAAAAPAYAQHPYGYAPGPHYAPATPGYAEAPAAASWEAPAPVHEGDPGTPSADAAGHEGDPGTPSASAGETAPGPEEAARPAEEAAEDSTPDQAGER